MTIERYRKITNGLAVFLPNEQSKTYWARIRIDKKDIKKSTKQRDINKAVDEAYKIKYLLENRLENGLPVTNSKTINSISKEYLQWAEIHVAKSSYKKYKKLFEKILIPNYGSLKLDELRANQISNIYPK